MLAELESESHRGAAPAKPQSSRPFVPTPMPVACPVAAVAMPVASPGAAAAKLVLPRKPERFPADMDCVACWNFSRGCTAGGRSQHARTNALRGSCRRCSRPMPRRLKQRARSEGTEWASEPRCCSAVNKVSALHHLYFLCSSCTAMRAHCTLSDRLISSRHGGDGAGEGDSAGQGQARPFFLFFFFSFSPMISYHKLGTLLNLSYLIQGYDKL